MALVRATPDQFAEVARLPAIEGKTWNNPVLAGDVLLVRNGQEVAAFRLSLAGRSRRLPFAAIRLNHGRFRKLTFRSLSLTPTSGGIP